MTAPHSFSRRNFLNLAAAASVAAATSRPCRVLGNESEVERKAAPQAPLAAEKLRWLADKFVEWQTPYGRIDRAKIPAALNGDKDYPASGVSKEMYKAYDATGDGAYLAAADRYFTYYMTREVDAHVTPARHGMELDNWGCFKRHYPQETDFDERAHAVFGYLMSYRWEEGSFFRNGYKGDEETYFRNGKKEVGMDAANSADNAVMGLGLLNYYAFTKKPEALAAAEGLAQYFLTECEPMTYQGCWSTPLGTWVVAPTANTVWEHHLNTPVSKNGWGLTAQLAVDYLLQLYGVTAKEELKQPIQEKCVRSMKWQFDQCQFDDGSLGMCGRDDKFLGMTAAAVQTFLWNRAAGFLTANETAQYRLKALAATNWLLDHLNDEGLEAGGYYRVTGQTHPGPRCHLYWGLSWALEPLIRYQEI